MQVENKEFIKVESEVRFSAAAAADTRGSSSSWTQMKHKPAQRSDVHNPIRQILEREMKPNPNHELPMINLGLGEPSRANGFELPEVINEAIIEVVDS